MNENERQIDAEIRNSSDRLGEVEREVLGDQLMAQREVLELEYYALTRWMIQPPGSKVVRLAGGGPTPPTEETVPGDDRDPFNGAVIINPSPYAVGIGFAPGGGIGNPLFTVPPGTYLTVPVRFVNLSVALVTPALDLNGPEARIVVSRLRVPPLGIQAGQITGSDMGGIAETEMNAAATAAAPAGGTTVVTLPLAAGLYRVQVTSYQTTAPDVNAVNMRLLVNGVLKPLPSTAVPIVTTARVVVWPSVTQLEVRTAAVAGAGAIYYAAIAATRLA